MIVRTVRALIHSQALTPLASQRSKASGAISVDDGTAKESASVHSPPWAKQLRIKWKRRLSAIISRPNGHGSQLRT